ncbi:MAG: outer membrane protein transport protein [Pseudomonadota bacterium]
MIRLTTTALAALLIAQTAFAGGVERTIQSVAPIFEEGRYVEFSFRSVAPSVDGVGSGAAASVVTPTPGVASGEMAPSYGQFGMALKMPITEKVDVAFILDEPFGADTAYPAGTYFAASSTAELNSVAATGVLRYKFNEKFSAFAGARAQTLEATASLPSVAGYTANGQQDLSFGYLVGAAYERKELGLRVALTYNSSITHDLTTTETSVVPGLTSVTSNVEIVTPESVNLEFRTGLNPKTLLFGYVRWVNWSDFTIAPGTYRTLTTVAGLNPSGSALVSFQDDTITYNLGIGRRLSDTWSIAGSVTYEEQSGNLQSNLAPRDGRTSVGLAATYTQGNMKVTTGISYTWLGDANTQLLNSGVAAASFTDNSTLGFGMKVGFNF